jgi:HEAT repeat protein
MESSETIQESSDEHREAREILQNILKAKKTFRMYPKNNPVYIKTLEDTYVRFREFLDYRSEIVFAITQNTISYDAEKIYESTQKEDNFALFFFKDGLREITFKKGLLQSELEEFLQIIALDFDREGVDDDLVTLFWERDFENIQYVVDDTVMVDLEEEEFAAVAEEQVKEQITDVDDLMKAYADGFKEEDVKTVSIVPLSDRDLQQLVKEIEKDSPDKIDKISIILFEIISGTTEKRDIETSFTFLKDAIAYALRQGDINIAIDIMARANELKEDPASPDEVKKYMNLLATYLGTEEILLLFTEILDSGVDIEEHLFKGFVGFLDKNAIPPMIKFLGEMKTIRARRSIIELLVTLGKKDIHAISRGLNDQRWYVVRNIIFILRRIGDRQAIEHLLKIVRHGDIRVRKEVIKALGELGEKEVIQTLRDCLNDAEPQVRIASAKAFGTIASDVAKKILLEKMSDKEFNHKDFDEKKDFFEVLSKWKDPEVFDFLVYTAKKSVFFKRASNNENKAAAILCLGYLGNPDALPILYKLQKSKNKLIRDFSSASIKRLEHVQ